MSEVRPDDSWQIEEFRYLTQEMTHNREKQGQAFLYGLIAIGALLGFGASSYPGLPSMVFLLPIVIVIPVAIIIIRLLQAIDRVEAYIRVRIPSADVHLGYTAAIRRFRWLGIGLYLPVFKFMVYTYLGLGLTCISLTLYLPFVNGGLPDSGALALALVALLANLGVIAYLLIADQICAPGRLEDSWREALDIK